MFRRSIVIVAATTLMIPAIAGCGGSSSSHKLGDVSMDGVQLTAPDKLLAAAERSFLSTNQSDIDSKSAIVSADPRCYFRRSQKDSDEAVQQVFCGPIRRAGKDTTHVWDSYPVSVQQSDEPAAATADEPNAEVGDTPEESVVVDTSLLVRPDGKTPGDSSKLAAPKAPMSSLKNYAAVVNTGRQQTGLSFTKLGTPAVLRTPSATITVTGSAKSATVPGWFEALNAPTDETGADGGNLAKEYRPQDGQTIVAYQITVGPGASYPDSNDNSNGNPKDASTALSVQVGGQNLTIHDMSGNDEDSWGGSEDTNSTLTVDCSSLPCSDDDTNSSDTKSYVLIASAPEGDAKLASSVDGQTQTLPLAGGAVDGDVSDVTAARNNPSQQVNTTIPSDSVEVSLGDYDDQSLDIGGSISTVFLTSFDTNAGWAPAGKAWLEVPIQNMPDNYGDEFTVNWQKTNTLLVGKKTYRADDSAGLDGTATFLVPDSFTTGTFRYQPQGTVTGGYPEVTKPFKAKKPYDVKISIPQS